MSATTTHVWRPSSARLIFLDGFVAVPRGAAVSAAPLVWPAKDPADVLDYQLDFSAALVGNDGDSLASIGVAIQPQAPGDLIAASIAADGTAAVIWLSQGQAGTTYTVTVSVVTVNGRTIQRSVSLPVLPLSSNPAPQNAIDTGAGAPLTDQNGSPVLAS